MEPRLSDLLDFLNLLHNTGNSLSDTLFRSMWSTAVRCHECVCDDVAGMHVTISSCDLVSLCVCVCLGERP